MKLLRFLLLLATIFFVRQLYSQTTVFHENFEPSSYSDSLISSPSGVWSLSSTLHSSSMYSDSCKVKTADTTYLTSTPISTVGMSYVVLSFDQICKIEFFDHAIVQISVNNGLNWQTLPSSTYLGSGQYGVIGNKFTSSSYSTWLPANSNAIPNNSWWKHEVFDISALAANVSNLRIRFVLQDGNSTGAAGNYGWLIDNVEVNTAIDELIPPSIILNSPVLQDSVFNEGPFNISAQIADNSGIMIAKLVYTINGGSPDTVDMINSFGNNFLAVIDSSTSMSTGDTICYFIYAIDSSLSSNITYYPAASCISFVIYIAQPYPGCTSYISSFPFIESFDNNFVSGSGYPSYPGSLGSGWSRTPSVSTSDFMWLVYSGATSSTLTGPDFDHTTGYGNYLYTEGSYGSAGQVAELLTPCLDLTQLDVPVLEFYYHLYGSTMGELHVDIWYGNSWLNDVFVESNDFGNQWVKCSINLSNYKSVTKIRFRAVRGSNYYCDMAIDDVKIWQPPQFDAGVLSIDEPSSPATTGNQTVKVSFANYGSAILNKLTLNWTVNGVLKSPYVWTGTLLSGQVADSVSIGTHTLISGPSSIKVWSSLPNDSADAITSNDTATTAVIACDAPLHGIFSIGGSNPDFLTLNDALFAIENCGIDSAIVFNIFPGTYNEQLDIDTVIGASATNTVTFQSVNGDTASVIVSFNAASTSNNFIVRLKGTRHFKFKNITLKSLNQSYGRLFLFENSASYNDVEGCNLVTGAGPYSYNSAFYSSSTIASYNRIINNSISNGYYAFYFTGVSSAGPSKGNIISGNSFKNFYYYGAYLLYQDSIIINGNYFKNDSTSSSTYPVYMYYCSGKYEFIGNNIISNASSTIYGLRLYYCTSTLGNEGLIANNMISLNGASNYPYGIYIYSTSYANIFHNTVLVNTATSLNSRVLYQYSGSNLNFKNNIFANNSTGMASYIGTTTAISSSDYNSFFSNGQYLSYWNGNITNLQSLQAASLKESNSVSIMPSFVSNSNLHLIDGTVNNLGIPISSVAYDIDGELRNPTNPSIGADELTPIPFDAGVAGITSPGASEDEADSVDVLIVIKNFGTDTFNSVSYSGQINGALNFAGIHNSLLMPGQSDTLSVLRFKVLPGSNVVCASVSLTNDSNNYNDTYCKQFYGVPMIDVGITQMLKPDSGYCFTSNETLRVVLKSFGSDPLNLQTNPVTIYTEITGPVNVVVPNYSINSGILQTGDSLIVNIANNIDMNHTGQYKFKLWSKVNGDGEINNDTMKTRTIDVFATVANFPFKQDFENFEPSSTTIDPGSFEEGWLPQTTTTDYQWFVGSGSTYTSATGPSSDHTKGSASGKYVYAEAYGYYGASAYLISPCINLSGMINPTLRFWYFMFGANIHSLRVDVFANNSWYYSVGHVMGQQQNSTTDDWEQAIVDLSQFAGQTVKLRFRAIKTIGYEADMAIDDVQIYEPKQRDAGIVSFLKPTKNFGTQGGQVEVEVKIENLGLDTITTMQVGYMAGNYPPVLENWTGVLPPYSSQNYTFNTDYTAKPGELNICAFTNLSGDQSSSNDTSCLKYTGVALFNVPYFDDFDGMSYFVSSDGNQQWARGLPSKTKYNSCYSGNYSWITSLTDNYLNNSYDFVYSPYFNFSTFNNTYLRFWHRIDSEPGGDGGSVEYSNDGGNSWIALGYITDPASTNWYNANVGGLHMWSNADSGWIQSTYDLSMFNGMTSPVQFRFRFYSNTSINNYEGWQIDNFEISPSPITTDAGVQSIITPSDYTSSGSNVTVKLTLKNYGTTTLNMIPVNYKVGSGGTFTETWMGSLLPGASTTYTFASQFSSPSSYTLSAWTSVQGDNYFFNDSVRLKINQDVGIINIPYPVSTAVLGDSEEVIIQFVNNGFDTLTSIPFQFTINGSIPVIETWTGVLPPNSFASYSFTGKFMVPYNIFNLCAKALLTDDDNASNNLLCKYLTGTVGFEEEILSTRHFVVTNSPNPFSKETMIEVNSPTAGEFKIEIIDLAGKVVSATSRTFVEGKNSFLLQRGSLEAGIYFYRIENKEFVAIIKLLVE